MAHKWARSLHNPYRLGGSPPLQSGGQNQKWPTSGQGGYITPTAWGGPHRFRAGQNQKWPTSGQGGYITPTAWGVPTASERGVESEVAPKLASWLHHPCRLGCPHRFRAGGGNQKWPKSGQGGYITPTAWGAPPFQSAGQKLEVAHKWARWLHNPYRLGGPHPFRAGGRIRMARKLARWLHNPCRLGCPHRFRAGGGNQKWPTWGQCGYITPTAWGAPPFQSAGQKLEVAQKWARWLHNPYRLGGPTVSERGAEVRSGPQVGKVAT